MKKNVCIFLSLLACSCLLFSGCSMGRMLYRGDKSFISTVNIRYPHLENSNATLNAEDQSTFITYLEKTKVVKVEKSAVFNSRLVPDNYFAYIDVHGSSNEAISVQFYVFEDGKVQVNGQVYESWYDSQLNKESMDLILKYQGNNFNPMANLPYYNAATAKKMVDNDSQTESKTFFTSDKFDETILLKFLESLTSFSSNQMPKQRIVDNISQILSMKIVGETYAFTFNFNPAITKPSQRSYYFCGIVASSTMVRIIVEKKVKTKIKYILTDYEMDGSIIKDSIKTLVVAK